METPTPFPLHANDFRRARYNNPAMKNWSHLNVSPIWTVPIALALLVCQFTPAPPNVRLLCAILITTALLGIAIRHSP
jgi:hypothetical protein